MAEVVKREMHPLFKENMERMKAGKPPLKKSDLPPVPKKKLRKRSV